MKQLLICVALIAACAASADPARLERQGDTRQLIVDGRPFLILGGELGNSSASSAAYMAPHWPRLAAMNLNTVLAPVYWELIEPAEGKFDWTSVDALLRDARAHDLKLVVLWFGAWKNSMSTYVPSWVKRDPQRFPRAQLADGASVEILSAFSAATRDADVKAFATFMEHLKQVDSAGTVLMIQVENEIGMLPIARERGAQADKLFAGKVPAELTRALQKPAGTWAQVFGAGDAADENFTAWHYARFVEALVVRGQEALRHSDVRERGAQSHRAQARRISERRATAAPARCLEGGRAVARFPCARYLLPELRAARGALPARGQRVVHPRGEQRDESPGAGERVLFDRRARFVRLLAVLDRVAGRCTECAVAVVRSVAAALTADSCRVAARRAWRVSARSSTKTVPSSTRQ